MPAAPSRLALHASLGLCLAVAWACSAGGGTRSHVDGGRPPPGTDGAVRPVPDSGFDACRSTREATMSGYAPVDIIWVVDSSGSMSNEAARVQDNLNDFSTAIGMTGIDYRVVMITTSSFVSVPPPLGGSPRYLLIDREVSSNEPLQALLDEFPRYSDFLRGTAVTHIVATTDDESDLPWEDFDRQMLANLRGRDYRFHAIASERTTPTFTNPEGACSSGGFPPDGAAAPGEEYYMLAMARSGLTFSICTSDWSGLFSTLTAAIAVPQPLPCVYPIPDPPDGADLDPFRVNFVFTPSGGGEMLIPYVGRPDGPDCTAGGWYYDDPAAPDSILLCPSTCELINSDAMPTVEVAFGCTTFII